MFNIAFFINILKMSILPKHITIDDIKRAGGNCMSIATAESYYEIYLQYLIRKNRRPKMDAYIATSESIFKTIDVVMRAVKFGERLNTPTKATELPQ